MSLTPEAQRAFNILVRAAIKDKSSEELKALDRDNFLDKLLESINFSLKKEMEIVGSFYKTSKTPLSDTEAYNRKSQLEKSGNFLVSSSDREQLREHLEGLLYQEAHNALLDRNRVFSNTISNTTDDAQQCLTSLKC